MISLRRNTESNLISISLYLEGINEPPLAILIAKGRFFFIMAMHGYVMRTFRYLAFIVLVSTVMLEAGCGAQSKTRTYSRDGLLGASQANPNLITSPSYHNYNADTDLMKALLSRMPDIKDSAIFMNGPEVDVDIVLPAGTSRQKAEQIAAEAEKRLNENMPRYTIQVRVSSPRY